ncbi:MAG: D-aminoacyl-tRNA deacylase [Candidatus Bathyarchaeia archaeon]
MSSVEDEAGLNIAGRLIELHDFKQSNECFHGYKVYIKKMGIEEIKLIYIKGEPINAQYLDQLFNPRLIVFLSKHSSESGIPTLCVHTPGNFGRAELGGLPGKLSISPANAMRRALLEMIKGRMDYNLKYEVSYECTHHGPSLNVPTMFVELGSSERQWRDTQAAAVVARAALAAAAGKDDCAAVLGIGGPHYNRKFTELALYGRFAFGHIIPNYALSNIDLGMIKQCVLRTLEKVEKSVLDWKGIKGISKQKLLEYLNTLNLEVQKV